MKNDAEPPYENHDTIMMSFKDPNLVMHRRRKDCEIETPHHINDCGCFDWQTKADFKQH